MGFYERRIFPWILDRVMRGMSDMRAPTLEPLSGDVLEIGFGTGLNLDHYPDGVTRVSAVDPMDALPEKVQRRIDRARFPVERHRLPADGHLPFGDDHFDGVAVTWTLCTIPDAARALDEVRRVVRPGGMLHFVEHGASDDPGTARWQRRLTPLQKLMAGGCHLDRDVRRQLADAGFTIERLDEDERAAAAA